MSLEKHPKKGEKNLLFYVNPIIIVLVSAGAFQPEANIRALFKIQKTR